MVFVSVGQMLRWALMNEAGRWRPAVAGGNHCSLAIAGMPCG